MKDIKTHIWPGNTDNNRNYYPSLKEAAAYLQIPADHLLSLKDRKLINGIPDNDSWRFKQEQIDRLDKHLERTPSDLDFGRVAMMAIARTLYAAEQKKTMLPKAMEKEDPAAWAEFMKQQQQEKEQATPER